MLYGLMGARSALGPDWGLGVWTWTGAGAGEAGWYS